MELNQQGSLNFWEENKKRRKEEKKKRRKEEKKKMSALLESKCSDLQLLHRGKVRDVYKVDENSLLFVATDRISAFDVVMKNVFWTFLSCFFFFFFIVFCLFIYLFIMFVCLLCLFVCFVCFVSFFFFFGFFGQRLPRGAYQNKNEIKIVIEIKKKNETQLNWISYYYYY